MVDYQWIRLTDSNIVSPKSCLIGTIVATAQDDERGCLCLFDGDSATEPRIIRIKTGTGMSKIINFQPPLETHRGLYVEFVADLQEALIQYKLIDE